MPTCSAVPNSKHIGDRFEMRFMTAVQERGLFIKQMPERVGFDFLVGDGSLLKPRFTEEALYGSVSYMP